MILRRSSTAKVNDWYDSFLQLNKIVGENSKANLRETVDPLEGMSLIFKVIRTDMLTRQCLETILKHSEKDTLTIGFILPRELLLYCFEALVGKPEQKFDPLTLFGTYVLHNSTTPVNALYLFLEEDENLGDTRPDIQQKFMYGLCMGWVVTENFSKKRISFWQSWQEIFDKKSCLFLIKEGKQAYPAELDQKLQNIFWNITHYTWSDAVQTAPQPKMEYLTVKTGYRQPYREIPQDPPSQTFQFPTLFASFAKQSLKTNYKYSANLFCVPVVYYLCCWLKEGQRNQKQHLQLCLNGYFKHVEEEFCNFLDDIHLPMDELKLRAGVTAQKKTELAGVKRQMNMFIQLFAGVDNIDKYLQNLGRILAQKEADVYKNNTKRATYFNEDLIAKLYNDIITTKFDNNEASDRPYSEYKNDFKTFLDAYGSESIRTTTQLRTFNQFIMEKKIDYAQALEKEIQGSKRRYLSEKDELKDRLQIQMGVLNTIQDEIRQLQDQRVAIEDENESLKKALVEIRNKNTNRQMNTVSPLFSNKKNGNSTESKMVRKQAKNSLRRTGKMQIQRDKGKCCSCCCCCVM